MAGTLAILESMREQLLAHSDRFAVELFPDDVEGYFLRDEAGAILLQYAGSTFAPSGSSDCVSQRRTLRIAATVIARSQHDDHGALAMLDTLRLALTGFAPTDCLALQLRSEEFAGEAEGLWQYQVMLETVSQQVEDVGKTRAQTVRPVLTTVVARQAGTPLSGIVKPKI